MQTTYQSSSSISFRVLFDRDLADLVKSEGIDFVYELYKSMMKNVRVGDNAHGRRIHSLFKLLFAFGLFFVDHWKVRNVQCVIVQNPCSLHRAQDRTEIFCVIPMISAL